MQKFIPSQATIKAIAGAVVGVATYITTQGVVLDDPQWFAGLVIFLGLGYGVVWVSPANKE